MYDLILVEIVQLYIDKYLKIKILNGDFEYVNFNFYFWERMKLDGVRYKMEKYKLNCYYGKIQDISDENLVSFKSVDVCCGLVLNLVYSVCGVVESLVFFLLIGEWIIVDFNF